MEIKAPAPFYAVPKEYEKELDTKYGIVLGELKNGEKAYGNGLEKDVFNNAGVPGVENEILQKYESVPGFCSMVIKDEKELRWHAKNIYEVSYNHYAFGKEVNMYDSFPDWCCDGSSRNVGLGGLMLKKGYPNVVIFSNCKQDHTYIGLPFLFGRNKDKGFVITDPTSDQLFKDKKNAPRNYTFAVFGDRWRYITNWKKGADLFPRSEDNSMFSNLHTLRSNLNRSINIEECFEEVFKNGIRVDAEN